MSLRRASLAVLVAVAACAILAQAALAYQISYYLGSPSQPVSFTGGVAGQTCCNHFRLFNEATALRSANSMWFVDLYYGSTKIGSAIGTYYYRVYRNGANVNASCSLSSGAFNRVVRAYCDTTY
jgi:type 1 fimbria pilin